MTRRILVALLAVLTALLMAAPSAMARPDLVVSSAAEPPDFELAGGRFRHSYTISNNGNTRSRGARISSFLSADPVRGDDIALRGSARTSSLIEGIARFRQRTRRITLNIPDSVAPGFYFLIDCADGNRRVRESNERNNCRISGQRVGINASQRGEPGPAGVPGPPGPAGRDVPRTRFGRVTLDLGSATFDSPDSDLGDNEGSTSTTELAKVGPIIVRGLCRSTTNGDNDAPGEPFEDGGSGFDGDGDEAKILLYSERGEFSFSGLHGPRVDVAEGEGTPTNEDETGGEGKHMFIATMRDPDPNTTSGGSDDGIFEREWAFGFRSFTGWVSHSNGMELIISGYAGIDVLDVGDRCVFSGVVTVVNPGA